MFEDDDDQPWIKMVDSPKQNPMNPFTGDDWAISKAFPFAKPAATSNKTTSAKPFRAIRWANVPPI